MQHVAVTDVLRTYKPTTITFCQYLLPTKHQLPLRMGPQATRYF